MTSLDNANPEIFAATIDRPVTDAELDDDVEDEFDSREVFDILRCKNNTDLLIGSIEVIPFRYLHMTSLLHVFRVCDTLTLKASRYFAI